MLKTGGANRDQNDHSSQHSSSPVDRLEHSGFVAASVPSISRPSVVIVLKADLGEWACAVSAGLPKKLTRSVGHEFGPRKEFYQAAALQRQRKPKIRSVAARPKEDRLLIEVLILVAHKLYLRAILIHAPDET